MSPKRACRQFHTVRAVLTFLKCPSAIAGWCYCCRVLLRWTDTQSVQSQTFLKCPSAIAVDSQSVQSHCTLTFPPWRPPITFFLLLFSFFLLCSPHLVGLGLPTVPHSFYIPTSRTCLHQGTLCLNYRNRLIVDVLRMRVSLGSLKGSRSSHSLSKRACFLYTSRVSSCRQCLEKGDS